VKNLLAWLLQSRRAPTPVDMSPQASRTKSLGGQATSPPTSPTPRHEEPRRVAPGPRPGEQWVYVEAIDVDVASVVRSIEGVQKVTRERNGTWKIVVDRDINAEVAKRIVAKGGLLRLLISTPYFAKLGSLGEAT
jgi:hypothetical protein